jgi:putative acetyltransferase
MTSSPFTLRPYTPADEDAAIELWRSTWQLHYPHIDFAARIDWWRARWKSEIMPRATIAVAERDGNVVGFVTVEPASGYLDQMVVAPDAWGSGIAEALMAEARRIAPRGIDLHVNQDNVRAVRFYAKHGFAVSGADVNPRSGAALHRMSWRP